MDKSPLGRLPPELLKLVILALPLKDALMIDILCRELEAIVKASPRLQQALFFKPRGQNLAQQWVNPDGFEHGNDFCLHYTTTSDSNAAPPPRVNLFLPSWSPPPMIQDIRNVSIRLEYDMVATLPENATLRYIFTLQPPTSLQLWGRMGPRSRGEMPMGGVLSNDGGVRVGGLMELMEEFGEGAFVMVFGSGSWVR